MPSDLAVVTVSQSPTRCSSSMKKVFTDPQVLHNKMVVDVDHPVGRDLQQAGLGLLEAPMAEAARQDLPDRLLRSAIGSVALRIGRPGAPRPPQAGSSSGTSLLRYGPTHQEARAAIPNGTTSRWA